VLCVGADHYHLAVQAEVGYTGRIQGPANSDVSGNLELEYSVKYLDRYVERLNVGHPRIDLVPYVQLTMRSHSSRLVSPRAPISV
jgi:hypothetical protein